MSSNWTVRTAACGALVALALLPLSACSQNENNENQIAPLQATVTIGPVFDDLAVFFARNPASTGDLILLDVMLKSNAPVVFDAFTLEIHYDPGIVAVGGNQATSPFTLTPFDNCNASKSCCIPCVADPSVCCSRCGGNDSTCTDTPTPVPDPICTSDAVLANRTGELLIGVAASGECCPSYTLAGGQVKLMTLGFVPAGTGQSRIELVSNTGTSGDGQCEILSCLAEVSPPIPCLDGNATFTVTR